MNCTECQDNFSEILDDEAPSDMVTSFKAHLASCTSCASEFSGLKNTVQTLHAIPEQQIPADFLVGINEKLDTTTFSRLKNWFSFMGQHKLTASATMATLIVGVISATILQTVPETNQTQLTGATYTQAITTQQETKSSENNYYPGVPYLKGQPESTQHNPPTARPALRFASTNPTTHTGYYGTQPQRGSPHASATNQYTNFNTTAPVASSTPHPDFHIIIHPASASQQQTISRRISSNTKWKTHLHKSTLFVTLTDQEFPEFQRLFPPSAPPHKKLDLTPLAQKADQHLFTIAISFD